MSRFDRKPEKPQGDVPSPVLVLSASCEANYPTLLEYMRTEKFGDGSPRATTTVTFFFEDGGLKACVKDRETETVTFVTGDGFEAVLATLEALLAEDRAVWKPCRTTSQRGRKKK